MKRISIETKIVGGFAAALVLLLLAGGQMYRSLMEYQSTSRWVAHSHLVLEAIDEVRLGINTLVSSQRTYIITGKESYLAGQELIEARIRSVVDRIARLTEDNPGQMLRNVELSQLMDQRLKLMNSNIALYRAKGFDAARERIENGNADASMAAFERQCDAIKGEELTLLSQRTTKAEHNARQAMTVGGLLVAVTIVGMPLLWWRVRRSSKERKASDSIAEESLMVKQISANLKLEDTINTAYGDILTLINQDWPNVEEMTQAALSKFNKHVTIMAGICFLVQEDRLLPISSFGIQLPEAQDGIALEAMKQNNIVTLRNIPSDSILSVSTGVGTILPGEIIAIPLSIKNEIIAVVELASLHGFSETDLRIINRIAPQLGFGIKQRKLEQEVKDRSNQLESVNYELQTINEESQNLNRSLQDMNEELQVQQEEISDSNRRLEEASRTKSDFLANMSHELRTPLNSVIGFSEVLQDQMFGPINDKQQEYVQNILSSGKHLLSLINDILDLSKVESGRMELELSVFSLREALDASLMMLREKALKGSVTVQTDLAPEADVCISADLRKLKQILFNLVSNAVKFTPAGGSVIVEAAIDDAYIEIRVTDTGIGIRKEDIPKLFHPFIQLESVYTKGFEGTGLGLALTRQLVELHGGRIWVENRTGSGSRFCFTLPKQALFISEPATIPQEYIPTGGNTVLLIENDPLTQASLKYALESRGYLVLRASNGVDGIEMAQRDSPDLILLDLMMPGINGFDVADHLYDVGITPNIPILVLTAMDLTATDRERLAGKVWRIAEKGSLSTQNFIGLVESAIGSK